jgi:hypothetical protein
LSHLESLFWIVVILDILGQMARIIGLELKRTLLEDGDIDLLRPRDGERSGGEVVRGW